MTDWISLDPKSVAPKSETQVVDGIEVTISMPPDDVPDAVRGFFDEKLGRFVIEFRYLQREHWKHQYLGKPVALRVGKHSHRLYGLEIDVGALKVDAISLRLRVPLAVREALESAGRSKHSRIRPDNLEVAREVVKTREAELFKQLQPA